MAGDPLTEVASPFDHIGVVASCGARMVRREIQKLL
jgi:hypothetical protein